MDAQSKRDDDVAGGQGVIPMLPLLETYRHDCGVYVVVGQSHICPDVEVDDRGRLSVAN